MLSKKIPTLKKAAKVLAKSSGVSHTAALNAIAAQEGFKNWSVLMKNAGAAPGAAQAPPPSVDEMVDWFRKNHTQAIEESPYDSSEGGYLWPLVDQLGGVDEILRDMFPTAVDEDLDAAIATLDDDGPWINPIFMRLQAAESNT